MEIHIYADVVDPWCYIGKRRLDEAAASYDGDVTVRYRPFQLDPTPVPEPLPVPQSLATKFGGPDTGRQMIDPVTQVAAGAGLTTSTSSTSTGASAGHCPSAAATGGASRSGRSVFSDNPPTEVHGRARAPVSCRRGRRSP